VKRIKHNNLLPWFTQDHGTLPASYLASCEKFFKSLKLQAREDIIHEENERLLDRSTKRQASSLTAAGPGDSNRIIKEKL
tara:strand:- start:205 stop:444 length:240 start_codon:yes stop_codon:yes gene_type:complete